MNDHHLMLRKRPIHVTTDCVWTTQFCYWRCVWNLFAVECMKMNKKKTTLSDLLLRQFVHRCSCITWTLVEHALQKYTKHKYERVGVLLSPMQLIFTELQ